MSMIANRIQRPVVLLTMAALAGCSSDTTSPREGYPYQLFVPAAYAADSTTRWPLILSLHGAGGLQAADNLIEVRARRAPGLEFIVVAPATNTYWSTPHLIAVLDRVARTHRVDASRVYITGISMGAYGGFALASEHPTRFAGMALIAGGGNGAHRCRAKEVPLWAFHNAADPVVPASESEALVSAHAGCGAVAQLTIYEAVPAGTWAHNAWQAAWNTPELYSWLLSQPAPNMEFSGDPSPTALTR